MSQPLVAHVIQGARDLIADPHRWTQHQLATTSNGKKCEPWDAKAARFCAYGALLKSAYVVSGDLELADRLANSAVAALLNGKAGTELCGRLFHVNDVDGHKAVLDLFDKALAAQ